MKLIDDWHHAWKWLSMQFVAAAGTVQLALLSFPDTLRAYIPDSWMHVIVLALLAGAVLGRLVDQTNGARDLGRLADKGERDWEAGKTNK